MLSCFAGEKVSSHPVQSRLAEMLMPHIAPRMMTDELELAPTQLASMTFFKSSHGWVLSSTKEEIVSLYFSSGSGSVTMGICFLATEAIQRSFIRERSSLLHKFWQQVKKPLIWDKARLQRKSMKRNDAPFIVLLLHGKQQMHNLQPTRGSKRETIFFQSTNWATATKQCNKQRVNVTASAVRWLPSKTWLSF